MNGLSNSLRSTEVLRIGEDIVIDQDDHEIRLFPYLPDVLSSQIEGADVEYYKRQYKKLDYYDIIGKQHTHS